MAATFSNTSININGDNNTLASITSDINDTSIIQDMGNGLYEVYGDKVSFININAGATLTIGDANDFSVYEELRYIWHTNGVGRFYLKSGSFFYMYGNTKVIMNYGCTSAQYPEYIYFYSKIIHIEGNETYQPEIQGTRRFYIYPQLTNQSLIQGSEFTLKYMRIGNCQQNYMYFRFNFEVPETLVLDHITIINDFYTSVFYPFCFSYPLYYDDFIVPITNLTIENTKYIRMYVVYPYIKDSSIDVTTTTTTGYWYNYAVARNVNTNAGNSDIDYSLRTKKASKIGQYIDFYLENVDYQTNNSTSLYTYQGNTTLLNNFTTNKRLLTYGGATILFYNSDVAYNQNNIEDNFNSSIKKVYKLDLTITDTNDNPLDDVRIEIHSVNNEEFYNCFTGTLGKILSRFGIDYVFLSNEMKTPTLKIVSDDSNNTYHIVKISKDGYEGQTLNYVMSEDRTDTIKLSERPIYVDQNISGIISQKNITGKI